MARAKATPQIFRWLGFLIALTDPELVEQDFITIRQDLGAMRETLERDDPSEKLPGFPPPRE